MAPLVKKMITLAALTFLWAQQTTAQNAYSIGFHAGYNNARAHHLNGGSTSARQGRVAGVSLNVFPTNAMIGYRAEIHFIQKGASIKSDTTRASFYFNYIEIPLLFRTAASLEGIKPYVFAGPKIGFLIANRAKIETNGVSKKIELKDDTEPIDFSIDGGGGLEYTVGRMTTFAAIRYSLGLLDIDKSRNGEWYARDFQIVSGINFSLK